MITLTFADAESSELSGSGVVLDTLAWFVSVEAPALTVAVIVIVADPWSTIVPSEHETVASQVPWLGSTETSLKEERSIGSLTITS